MHFKTLFAAAVLASSSFASPIVDETFAIEGRGSCVDNARTGTVSYTPATKDNKSSVKTFKVDIKTAIAQAKAAGVAEGTSGDPHKYNNGDSITWGVANCDKSGASLLEYPVYWTTSKVQAWEKNKKTADQKQKTPIRVVYANANGCPIYCGVMMHTTVAKDYQGSAFFAKLT